MSNYLKMLKVDVRPYVKLLQGAAYIPWMRAVGLAGYPAHEVVMHRVGDMDSVVRPLFGGSVVEVDFKLRSGHTQRITLPILDAKSKPIEAGKESSRDVSDAISRVIARGVSMTTGLGLSLWCRKHQGNGTTFAQQLGVIPEQRNLGELQPLASMKEFLDRNRKPTKPPMPYLGWHTALAAAMVSDEKFYFEVVEYDTVSADGEPQRLPALRIPGKGWMVGVRVHWNGRSQTVMLPVMGVETVQTRNGPKQMEHQGIDTPTVFQWHSATMRCLAKAIALTSGYGISLYAGEFDPLAHDDQDGEEESAGQRNEAQRGEELQQQPSNVEADHREGPALQADGLTENQVRFQRIKEIRRIINEREINEKTVTETIRCPLENASIRTLERLENHLKYGPKAANHSSTTH